jgi:hypothetical protein
MEHIHNNIMKLGGSLIKLLNRKKTCLSIKYCQLINPTLSKIFKKIFMWILDFYYHNVSPGGHAKILLIVIMYHQVPTPESLEILFNESLRQKLKRDLGHSSDRMTPSEWVQIIISWWRKINSGQPKRVRRGGLAFLSGVADSSSEPLVGSGRVFNKPKWEIGSFVLQSGVNSKCLDLVFIFLLITCLPQEKPSVNLKHWHRIWNNFNVVKVTKE